ncbi:MAG: sigma-54-dependent transcriptional regulator [Leptospirillum sp.]
MKILVIDDEEALLEVLAPSLERDGHEVATAKNGEKAFCQLEKGDWDVVLLDLKLGEEDGVDILQRILSRWPSLIVLIMTAFGRIEQAVEAMRAGAFDFLEKPFSLSYLRIRIDKVHAHLNLRTLNGMLREELGRTKNVLAGSHPLILQVKDQISRFAKVELPVLITGESGTGKEVAARMIVNESNRREKPFVVINCGAVPENLMESILFGHEKGAFTGAFALHKGKFELADGGTIFLDEIGELPLMLQVKLLRVIESGEFERVGGDRSIRVNVRIISATNRNLEKMIQNGDFRSDLFYRLNVLGLEMPSLRERIDDLPELVDNILENLARDLHRRLEKDSSLIPLLKRKSWPGNIRELKNVLERMAVLSEDGIICGQDLDLNSWERNQGTGNESSAPEQDNGWNFHREMKSNEQKMIQKALEKAGGNHTTAARILGMKRTTFQYRLKKMAFLHTDSTEE